MVAPISVVDSGRITAPSAAGQNVLNDSTKRWADNIHIGKIVRVIVPTGLSHTLQIAGNSASALALSTNFTEDIPIGSSYEIAEFDLDTVLRIVFGGGQNISITNPLETHDPKLEDVEDMLAHPDHGLAAIAAGIAGIAGGAFYGSYGPKNVEVGNDVDFGVVLYDPAGNIIAVGEITPGTYTVRRVRAAVDAQIVAPAASTEAAGRVFITYDFPGANWAVGDIFYITFTGVTVTLDGEITEYPDLFIWGRVVREADISTNVVAIQGDITTILGRITAAVALASALTTHDTDIKALLGTITGYLDTEIAAILAAVDTEVAAIEAKLDTPANFMANVTALALEATLGTHDTDIKALLATIAGYIDTEIAAITPAGPTQAQMNTAHALLATVAKQNRVLCSMDFWSDLVEEVAVTGAQSTIPITGGNVVVADLPAGATIVRAIVMMKFRMVENTYAGVNKLDAASALPMQIDDAGNTGWLTCIDFVDDAFTLAASLREGGDVIIGDVDVAARVDGNDTYDFQWLNAKADQNNIQFNDVQMGLRIWYSL